MAASNAELENRLSIVENIIANSVVIPTAVLDKNDTTVADKTGRWVTGTWPGVAGGNPITGLSNTATPTVTADFDKIIT